MITWTRRFAGHLYSVRRHVARNAGRKNVQIMLLADEGKTQSQICKQLGCSRVTVRHWILVASSGEAHNSNASPLGRPKTVNDQYQERLKELVSRSPKEFGYPFRCWTAQWLSKHLASELSVLVLIGCGT
ncbi:MAG: helix-turn-helix domain-containing protein [Tolypothrix carrinoi HA7290-LM1]|nr:helix-turn-helix domain-containing protein [Tolypothrix carrinoi HA7290-LM1]